MITEKEEYRKSVEQHMNAEGWFPDSILGQNYWVLWYCERKLIGDNLYWRFV